MKNLFFCLTIIFFFNSCQEDNKSTELLPGTWKVDQIYENQQLMDINTSNIQFIFDDKGHYTYRSNGNSREAGPYYVTRNQLYTTDTINEQRIKKSVSIKMLTADSLYLDMNKAGIPQLWKLYRE